MEVKKVYVIYNEDYTRNDIINDIAEENYPFEFSLIDGCTFQNGYMKTLINERAMSEYDEVWLFGNCEEMEEYLLAKGMGKDVWQMK